MLVQVLSAPTDLSPLPLIDLCACASAPSQLLWGHLAALRAKALPPVIPRAGGIAAFQLVPDAKAGNIPCHHASHYGLPAKAGADVAMSPVSPSGRNFPLLSHSHPFPSPPALQGKTLFSEFLFHVHLPWFQSAPGCHVPLLKKLCVKLVPEPFTCHQDSDLYAWRKEEGGEKDHPHG